MLDTKNILKSSVFMDALNIVKGNFYRIEHRKFKRYLEATFKADSFNYFGSIDLGIHYKHHDFTQYGSLIPKKDFYFYRNYRVKGMEIMTQVEQRGFKTFVKACKVTKKEDMFERKRSVNELMKDEMKNHIYKCGTFVVITGDGNFYSTLENLVERYNKNIVLVSKGSHTSSNLISFIKKYEKKCFLVDLEAVNIREMIRER